MTRHTVTVRLHHTDAAGVLFYGRLFELAQEALEEALAAARAAAGRAAARRRVPPAGRACRSRLHRTGPRRRRAGGSPRVPGGRPVAAGGCRVRGCGRAPGRGGTRRACRRQRRHRHGGAAPGRGAGAGPMIHAWQLDYRPLARPVAGDAAAAAATLPARLETAMRGVDGVRAPSGRSCRPATAARYTAIPGTPSGCSASSANTSPRRRGPRSPRYATAPRPAT